MDLRTSGNGLGEAIARISPELALVDPDLGRRLKRRLRARMPRTRPPLPVLHAAPPSSGVSHARDDQSARRGGISPR